VPTKPKSFGQWRVLLIAPDAEVISQVQAFIEEYLPYSQPRLLEQYPTRALLEETLSDQGTNLCFVDANTNREWAQALLSDVAMMGTKIPVIAVHRENDSEFILRTLRQGATEVLVAPVKAEQFVAMMERVSALHGCNRRSAKLYCVMPAKGACGATTVACNLAAHFVKASIGRVLLADLDPLTGTISFHLKLKSNYSFMDAITRGTSLDEDIWKGLVTPWYGVDALLSPEKPVHGIEEISNAGQVIEFARALYDLILADMNGPYGQWAVALARQCDELLLVTTNELPSLQAAQRALAYLEQQRVERSKIRIVVNRYHRDVGLSQDVIEAALHTEVYHLIPSDYEGVQRALVEGRAVQSSSPVGKALQALSGKLCGKPVKAAPTKNSSLSNLFSFLKR
jgi:pilus assembly protein CpaE